MNTRSFDSATPVPHPFAAAMLRRDELLRRAGHGDLGPDDSREFDELTDRMKSDLSTQPHQIRRLVQGKDDELLIRLVSAEPVHPLEDPEDLAELHNRVAEDRRCFVLENPVLAGRPLDVVWVALCRELPTEMDNLLSEDRRRVDPADAKIAVFYSIWTVEPGLAGIPLASSLLSLAMETLATELPGIETYTTLSPILGFRNWLEDENPARAAALDTAGPAEEVDDDTQLLAECARYLCTVDDQGRPIDPVARFHMRNGARMWKLIAEADPSKRGWSRSWGAMVNYRYSPEDLEANITAFEEGTLVVSKEILNRIGYV